MDEAAQVLAEILNAERDKFNARFVLARSKWRALSPQEWKIVLAEDVAPLVLATHQAIPERAATVAEAAYESALELLARDQFGPRASGAMAFLWREILPQVAHIVAVQPRRVLNRACNALLELQSHHLAENWILRLRDLAARGAFAKSDAEQFERALLILAWLCGLAHARDSALKYLGELPAELAQSLLGVTKIEPESWAQMLGRLQREPFFDPTQPNKERGENLRLVATVGDWEAFGGEMSAPPRVLRRRGALWAWSGRAWWRLHADSFGATLSPARFTISPDELPDGLQRDESCGAWKLRAQKSASSAENAGAGESLQVTHGPKRGLR